MSRERRRTCPRHSEADRERGPHARKQTQDTREEAAAAVDMVLKPSNVSEGLQSVLTPGRALAGRAPPRSLLLGHLTAFLSGSPGLTVPARPLAPGRVRSSASVDRSLSSSLTVKATWKVSGLTELLRTALPVPIGLNTTVEPFPAPDGRRRQPPYSLNICDPSARTRHLPHYRAPLSVTRNQSGVQCRASFQIRLWGLREVT